MDKKIDILDSNPGMQSSGSVELSSDVHENNSEVIHCENTNLVAKRATYEHKTIEERLTAYYGMPIDQIGKIYDAEYAWGKPKGHEVF